MIKKNVINIFGKNEILKEENFHRFTEKKKIVTYVPEEFADKLMTEMSKAGAGKIGEYEMCSFRVQGKGTFKAGKNSNPFKGKKNKISYEDEVRFEMECETEKMNQVLDMMLRHHPYEEAAYEIFNFYKREKKSSGIMITLKKKISYQDLLKKLNRKIEETASEDEISFYKIALTDNIADENMLLTAKILECGCLISKQKNKYHLYKIS